jgi:hypothetical protein
LATWEVPSKKSRFDLSKYVFLKTSLFLKINHISKLFEVCLENMEGEFGRDPADPGRPGCSACLKNKRKQTFLMLPLGASVVT